MLGMTDTMDLDVVVLGDGIAFARLIAQALGGQVESHEQFRTATVTVDAQVRSRSGPRAGRSAVVPALRIDVASCRKERYVRPAAYPKVSAGTLRDDLFRRDFTVNAMAMALEPRRFGRLIDPFGGAGDLQRRRLRVLHERSFLDDPSRILRAARFAARLTLEPDASTARYLREALDNNFLQRLNRGRIRKEFERMVQEPDPVACLAWLGRWLTARVGSSSRGRNPSG